MMRFVMLVLAKRLMITCSPPLSPAATTSNFTSLTASVQPTPRTGVGVHEAKSVGTSVSGMCGGSSFQITSIKSTSALNLKSFGSR